MHILKLFTLLITFTLFDPNSTTKNNYLQGYGTYPVNWDDNVLMFFVTLKNNDNFMLIASVEMIECCEKLYNDDMACNHMQLDGIQIKLGKKNIANCTLIYPNCYPHNRKGICNVKITLYNNLSKIAEFQQNIHFDTTINAEDIYSLQESMLNVENKFKLCKSPDEDPLDLCSPVNCHMKYQGFRSLFDPVERQCIPIPICNNNENINSSNIVYDLYSNKCIELTDNVSIASIDFVLNETPANNFGTSKKTKKLYNSNIQCHHGKMDEMNTTCICDNGWSSSINGNFPIVSTVPVHMCTIKLHSKNLMETKRFYQNNFFWTFVLSLIWIVILQLFLCLIL